MATPTATAQSLSPAASMVGNAFVVQYYNVLHQQPDCVHKFYTDASRLTRAEGGPKGPVETVMTQAAIHEKVMSVQYGDGKAEIHSVDSQESLGGGVLVMVTGVLISKTGGRNFVQTFFLAPQDNGYFVLNDVFRYLEEEAQVVKHEVSSLPNGLSEPQATYEPPEADVAAVPEHDVHEAQVDEVSVPSYEQDAVEAPEAAGEEAEEAYMEPSAAGQEQIYEAAPQAPHLDEKPAPQPTLEPVPPQAPQTPAQPAASEEPAKVMSYASVLAKKKAAAQQQPQQQQQQQQQQQAKAVEAPVASPAPPPATPPTEPAANAPLLTPSVLPEPASSPDSNDDTTAAEPEGDGRSIFIRNLPFGVTVAQVFETFSAFGTIVPDGVQVRNGKAVSASCFGFVQYEDPASVQLAIKAAPVYMSSYAVRVEEKLTNAKPRGGASRGRGGQARGSDRPYRGDSMRSRASFGSRPGGAGGLATGTGAGAGAGAGGAARGAVSAEGNRDAPAGRGGRPLGQAVRSNSGNAQSYTGAAAQGAGAGTSGDQNRRAPGQDSSNTPGGGGGSAGGRDVLSSRQPRRGGAAGGPSQSSGGRGGSGGGARGPGPIAGASGGAE